MLRRSTGRRLLLCATPAVLLALAGCAHKATPRAARPAGSPTASLDLAAAAEARRPKQPAVQTPLPEGVEPLLGQSIAPDDPRAHLRLDEVTAQLAGPAPEVKKRDAPPEALRRYVEGKTKLLEGDTTGALQDLKAATELDPEAVEPWRELAEAQLVAGQRAEAIRSLRAAAASGEADARTLELLGRFSLERSDFEEAGRYLARAGRAHPERVDPGLPTVISVGLARALASQGYILAAKESLESVVTNPPQLTSTSRYSSELGAVFRRQGDLWREVGDALCRLGDFAGAAEAYEQAAELPMLDRTPIRPRLVYALLRDGRPAQASLKILQGIGGAQGRVRDSDLGLLRYVAQNGGDAEQIAQALDHLRRAEPTPSLARDLSLARAKLLSGRAGRQALKEHLAAFPADIAAVTGLLGAQPEGSAAVAEADALAKAHAAFAKLAAEALLRSKHGGAPLPEPSSRLLRGYIAAKQGRLAEGLALVSGVEGSGETGLAAAAAQVEIGLDAGRPDAADAALVRLGKTARTPDAKRVLVRCLLQLQQVRAAEALMPEILSDPKAAPSARVDDLLLAADIAARLNRPEETEQRLVEAAAIDPFDERPLSLLIVLSSADGSAPDNARLAKAVRELRQNAPDGRTIRMLRAREQMRRQQWAAAETDLRAMIEEDPGDATPMELLAATWTERYRKAETAPSAQEARAWLTAQLKRRPQSPLLLASLAALETALGKPGQAEAPLREALAAGAGPDVSRLLERLLRDGLRRAAEADELSRKRLADRRRTVAESLEFAELSLSWNEPENAVAILRGGLPPDVELSGDQARQAVAIAGRCMVALRGTPNVARTATDIARLFDRCLPTIPKLAAELHEQRVEAIAASPATSKQEILRAIELWAQQYPRMEALAHASAVQFLIMSRRQGIVPELLPGAAPDGVLDPKFLYGWFESIIKFGSAESAREMIDELHRLGKLDQLAGQLGPNMDADTVRDLRTEVAYTMGVLFSRFNHDADAAAMYEYALRFDPDHPWVCNNLGYWLADRGEDLDRASQLLERAYARLPAETPIIDSLAWLRYKQGVIRDEPDHDGKPGRRGALSLLREAALSIQGQGDNTIQDHFGDALWLAGSRDEALKAWERAAILSQTTLEALRAPGNRDANAGGEGQDNDMALVVESRAILESTTKKREAAAAGRPVQVAPQIADPNPQPLQAKHDEPKQDEHP